MSFIRILFILSLCTVISKTALSQQSSSETIISNRIINKYFTADWLASTEANNTSLYTNLIYYFTESFNAVTEDCPTCPVDEFNLFNIELFDVFAVEKLREQTTNHTLHTKNDTYIIELHSTESLQAALGGLTVKDLLLKTFPNWKNSGNLDADKINYKNDVKRWSIVFKDLYAEFISSPETLIITFDEFITLPPDRQISVINHPTGYFIKLP